MIDNVVCFDFDETIASYKGWRNEGFTDIDGEPLPGAREGMAKLRAVGVFVLVHSVRCGHAGGTGAVANWLEANNIVVDGVCFNKPPADLFVDDNGWRFTKWDGLADELLNHLIPQDGDV